MTFYCTCGTQIRDQYDGHWEHISTPLTDCPKPRLSIARDETGRFVDGYKPLSAPVSARISWRGVMAWLKFQWRA